MDSRRFVPMSPAGWVLVAALALFAALPLSAGESVLVVVDPRSDIATRIVVERGRDARAVITARGGATAPMARAGIELPWLVAGPITLGGTLAEIARPASGGARSPRWYAPASIDLDASLKPGSRAGIGVRAVPGTHAALWLADDTLLAATALRARAGAVFADGVVLASRPLLLDAPGLAGLARRAVDPPVGEEATEASWFAAGLRPRRIVHAIARAGALLDRGSASAALYGSLPNARLPGVGIRLAARGEPARWLRVDAVAALASPDLREPSGDRAHPPARWEAASTIGRDSALSLGVGRTYAAANAAYAGVALAPGRLAPARTDCEARVSVRPRAGGAAPGEGERALVELRSAAVGVLVRAEPDAAVAWRADARASLALRERAVEVEPSLRLDVVEGIRIRLRALLRRRDGLGAGMREVALVGRAAYEIGPPWASGDGEAEGGDAGVAPGEFTASVELRLGLEREGEATGPG